jgi:uncharacterized phage infection (PIP) family protein YhgE
MAAAAAVVAVAVPSTQDIIQEKNTRIDQCDESRERISRKIVALSEGFGDCADGEAFDALVAQLREERTSLRELGEEMSRLSAEVTELRAGLEGSDDGDDDDDDDDDDWG